MRGLRRRGRAIEARPNLPEYPGATVKENGPSTGGHAETAISSDAKRQWHPVVLIKVTGAAIVPSTLCHDGAFEEKLRRAG
jgi:hypothetical protein